MISTVLSVWDAKEFANANLHIGGLQSFDNQWLLHSHFPVFVSHFPLLLQCESYLQTNSGKE